jgi:hypothetical protein
MGDPIHLGSNSLRVHNPEGLLDSKLFDFLKVLTVVGF